MFINKSSKKHPTTILLSSVLLTSGVIVTLPAHADSSTTSKVGDVLSFAIPAAAYGSTYYMDD